MRMGSVDGREAFAICSTNGLGFARGSAGRCGCRQGEQQRQWSSGKAVVRALPAIAVCGARSGIGSNAGEFIGAEGSHRSNAQ
jgi:hypothetical protein